MPLLFEVNVTQHGGLNGGMPNLLFLIVGLFSLESKEESRKSRLLVRRRAFI